MLLTGGDGRLSAARQPELGTSCAAGGDGRLSAARQPELGTSCAAGGDGRLSAARQARTGCELCRRGGWPVIWRPAGPNSVLFCDLGVISGLFFGKIATD